MILGIEEKYRSILNNIEELYYEVDLAGNLTFFNNSMTWILGYSREELMGMNNRQYMSAGTADRVYQTFNQVYRTGIPTKAFDWELIRKDGTVRVLETSVSLMRDPEGQPVGFFGIGRDITERKQAERELKEREQKYRTILNNIEELYYEVDLTGNLTISNDSMSKILGYSKDELIGMNNRQYMDDETSKKVYEMFNQVYRTGIPAKAFDWELIRKDGTRRILETSISLMHDSEGRPRGFYGIGRDITDRKRAEEELRAEKRKFQILSENAPFAMVMIDQVGTFRYINPKFTELFGYDLTDVPDGRIWFRKAYPDSHYRHDVISAWKEDLKIFKPGEKRPRVFTVTCKDGSEKIINFIPVQLETGENLMACEDITERKQAEAELRKGEEKYRTILHSIEDFYYEVDLAGNMTFFNDPLMKLSGYSDEELISLNYRKYVSGETAKKVYQTFNEVYRTGVPAKGFDWEVIRKDGTKRFFETSVSLRRDPKGQPVGFFGVGRDITERKQAEEQERNLQRAKDKVLHHLSHELRTPLAVIQANMRILKRKALAQTSPIVVEEGVFELMERNLSRISEIECETNVIIRSYQELEVTSSPETIGSKEPLSMKTISLYPFIEQILYKVKQDAAHRDLRIQLDGTNGVSLNMDAGVLGDILMGLLRNSIENTPDGGLVRVVLEKKSQWIRLKVQDFGVGITEENQRHLFDGLFHIMDTALYATKKPYDFGAGGKGLDLLKIKVYSKRFGFDISVGSQRCIHLPKQRDLCPGKIALCISCKKPEDCLSSGGSTFCLSFSCLSNVASLS